MYAVALSRTCKAETLAVTFEETLLNATVDERCRSGPFIGATAVDRQAKAIRLNFFPEVVAA